MMINYIIVYSNYILDCSAALHCFFLQTQQMQKKKKVLLSFAGSCQSNLFRFQFFYIHDLTAKVLSLLHCRVGFLLRRHFLLHHIFSSVQSRQVKGFYGQVKNVLLTFIISPQSFQVTKSQAMTQSLYLILFATKPAKSTYINRLHLRSKVEQQLMTDKMFISPWDTLVQNLLFCIQKIIYSLYGGVRQLLKCLS